MDDRINKMLELLDERQRRLCLANEAIAYGYGGISAVSRISDVSRTTITAGIKELKSGEGIIFGGVSDPKPDD